MKISFDEMRPKSCLCYFNGRYQQNLKMRFSIKLQVKYLHHMIITNINYALEKSI